MNDKKLTFHLEKFSGPLDLLIHLIGINKIDIYDIPISQILTQYIAYIDCMDEMDMELTGEFILMASQLIYIKSKMLIPKHNDEKDEEDQEDSRMQLVQMLLEYQRYKSVSKYFSDREKTGIDLFVKGPEDIKKNEDDSDICEDIYKLSDLAEALKLLILKKIDILPPKVNEFTGIVGAENVPVDIKITHILEMFAYADVISFKKLFETVKSRSELIATFLAVLEICKTHKLEVLGGIDNVQLAIRDYKKGDHFLG